MIIVAILGVLFLFSARGYMKSKALAADETSVILLNSATAYYILAQEGAGGSIFQGTGSDRERLQILLEQRYLEEIPVPRQSGAVFCWNMERQKWQIVK
ncbi:MAG: hypothetical protein GX434_04795 [Peptococcaceae bacterium]|nr:hypothetical protein [Peptococcaceae bacterium]